MTYIIGVGSDIVDIRRIERALDSFGKRFIKRCFTDRESHDSNHSFSPAASYAKRFAAKEACAKALGYGITNGISWQDFEISNNTLGRPLIELSGIAALLAKKTSNNIKIDLSLSDEYPYAQAFVILSHNTT